MRCILIDHARDKKRPKRGGNWHKIDLEKVELTMATPDDELLAIDEAIEQLAGENPECSGSGKAAVLRWPIDGRGRPMPWESRLARPDGIGHMPVLAL